MPLKEPINHLVNFRVLTSFHPIERETELLLKQNKNYLFDLSYLSVLNVTGDKAKEFLQGQFTCDLNSVSDIQIVQGAQCNLKGRILSLVDIIDWNGLKLVLPSDLIESTKKSLSKTAQLSRVSVHESTEFKIFGFFLQDAADLIPDSVFLPKDMYAKADASQYCYYHLGNGFYLFIIQSSAEQEFTNAFIEREQFLGSLAWHSLRLKHHQINIYPESRGLFLPHRLNLHKTKYISFDKGCYKGQEIIARTHYRATIKHELKTFTVSLNGTLYSGQKLFKPSTNIEIGEVIDYSYLENNRYLIAVSIIKEPIQVVQFEGLSDSISLNM